MNEDFGLLLTSGNARRLIRFQRSFNISVSDGLDRIAQQDLIDEAAFDAIICPADAVKLAITQFLLDCNLRGVIQYNFHREFSEIAVLNAVRLAKPEHVVIFTERRELWRNCAKAWFQDDICHIYTPFNLSFEEIDKFRSGVLIVDCDNRTEMFANKIRDFGSEFPRTIVYDPSCDDGFDGVAPWTFWARALFPTMPHPLYPRVVANIPNDWIDKHLSLFAPFYNVCLFPDLISDPRLVRQTTDAMLHTMVQRYKNLIT